MAVRLLADTAGEARAQASFPSVYDADRPTSDTAPASGAVSGQAQTFPWSQLTQAWDSLQKQLDNRGIQLGIRYDGEVFSDMSGGLRRGATYLGNLNLQLTVDTQRLIDWPGATVFVYGLEVHGGAPALPLQAMRKGSAISRPP
jgi:carbohydrate-selective porin OprB